MKVSLFCLAAMALAVTAEPIQRIPLFHKRHGNQKDFKSIPAYELKNGMLGGTVEIGNPPQNFTLAFDTSTGFSWVRAEQCTDLNCQERRPYEPKNSTTAITTNLNFTMDYGNAIVQTNIYHDTFRFNGITVKNMPFGNAYKMEGFNKGFDGYLGLGRNVNLNTTEIQYAKRDVGPSGFVPNAFQQSSGLQSSQFGMYTTAPGNGFSDTGYVSQQPQQQQPQQPQMGQMNQNQPSNNPFNNPTTNPVGQQNQQAHPQTTVTSGGFGTMSKRHYNEPAGYLVLGGIDTDAIKGKLYTMKVVDGDTGAGNWAVKVREAKFEGDACSKATKDSKAIFSSSTDVIGLPHKQADKFQKQWYAVYDKKDNTYQVPCCLMDKLKSFKMKLDKVRVVIPPSYFSHPREVESCCEMCHTHIGRSDSETDYVIGSAFTNAFYTQFDSENETIGFAMKKTHVEDGVEIWKE